MKISSIILRTHNVDRSTTFWSESVGMEIISQSPSFVFLDGGSVQLILSAIETPVTDESLTEVVFQSEDVRETHKAMVERGVPFEIELRTIMSADGRDLLGAHFRGPDGHYGTLTGWVEAD